MTATYGSAWEGVCIRGKSRGRRNDVDFLYALGIVLVIIGHSHPSDWSLFSDTIFCPVLGFIYMFHMPLFFFVAGFLLMRSSSVQRRGYGKWLGEKAVKMLTPYVFFSTLALLPKYLLEHGGDMLGLDAWFLFESILFPRQGVWGHFWFIPVLLLMYVGFGALRFALGGADRRSTIAILVVTAAVCLQLHFSDINIGMFGIEDVCINAVYMATGMLVYVCIGEGTVASVSTCVCLSLLLCLSGVGIYVILPNEYYASFMVSVLMLGCCLGLAQVFRSRCMRCIRWLSDNVLTVFIYSWFFQAAVMFVLGKLGASWPIESLAMFAVGLLGPVTVIWAYGIVDETLHCRFLDLIIGVRTAKR